MRISRLLPAAVAAAGAVLIWQGPAAANPGIANIAGTQTCSLCHMPGQEGIMPADKPPHGGFNPDGFRMWSLLQNNDPTCASSTNRTACAINTVWPNGVPSTPSNWNSGGGWNNGGNVWTNGNNNNWNSNNNGNWNNNNNNNGGNWNNGNNGNNNWNNNNNNSQPVTVKFEDKCLLAKTFYTIRRHGNPHDPIDFYIMNDHKVHIVVSSDSTFAWRCGEWPHRDDNFYSVN